MLIVFGRSRTSTTEKVSQQLNYTFIMLDLGFNKKAAIFAAFLLL
jgi:hypothetical protein